MVPVLICLVVIGLALRVWYGLRRPHFWLFAGLVVLVVLPIVVVVAMLARA